MKNKLKAIKWEKSFLKTVHFLNSAKIPSCEWSFGGGTALMLYYRHRLSKDIDIFLTDVQYLPLLSPRLNSTVEGDKEYQGSEEQSNFLKIKLKGDVYIDFIAAPYLTKNPFKRIKLAGIRANLETPEEIMIKKMFYRADQFKSRDIFDLAVVIENDADKLIKNIEVFRDKLPAIIERCELLRKVYKKELAQLAILKGKDYIESSFKRAINFLERCKG